MKFWANATGGLLCCLSRSPQLSTKLEVPSSSSWHHDQQSYRIAEAAT